ncbi:MAG: hypothetical protein LLG04_04005 [Parachlamydia sp.]|nr:hypothetical protein [Parachlamydia sp.]
MINKMLVCLLLVFSASCFAGECRNTQVTSKFVVSLSHHPLKSLLSAKIAQTLCKKSKGPSFAHPFQFEKGITYSIEKTCNCNLEYIHVHYYEHGAENNNIHYLKDFIGSIDLYPKDESTLLLVTEPIKRPPYPLGNYVRSWLRQEGLQFSELAKEDTEITKTFMRAQTCPKRSQP